MAECQRNESAFLRVSVCACSCDRSACIDDLNQLLTSLHAELTIDYILKAIERTLQLIKRILLLHLSDLDR